MKEEILRVARHELPTVCDDLLSAGARFLTMIASDESGFDRDRYALRYVFLPSNKQELLVVETLIREDEATFSSVTPVLPATAWYEREAHDLFGLRPIGHPDLRRLVMHENWPAGVYPLRKDYPIDLVQPPAEGLTWPYPVVEGEGVFEVPVGPVHAGVIEPGHFRFQVMGDSILHLEARLFYKHRGLEKRAETMDVRKGLFLAERICGVCAVSHALSYAQALEDIAEVDVPRRALYLRVLYSELERFYNHVGDVFNICSGIGFAYGSNRGARLKEHCMQLNDEATGHRYLRGVVTLGGVALDPPDATLRTILKVVESIYEDVMEAVEFVAAQGIVQNRLRSTGCLTHQVAADFAAVGPAARASGIDFDTRRDVPYAAYPELTFHVPTLMDGDVFARFWLKVLELEQTVSLIKQAVNNMPSGPIRVAVEHLPADRFSIGISESARGDNVHFVHTGPGAKIYRYRVRSASYANWPVVPLSVAGDIIPDFPLINKSYELCYACCDR